MWQPGCCRSVRLDRAIRANVDASRKVRHNTSVADGTFQPKMTAVQTLIIGLPKGRCNDSDIIMTNHLTFSSLTSANAAATVPCRVAMFCADWCTFDGVVSKMGLQAGPKQPSCCSGTRQAGCSASFSSCPMSGAATSTSSVIISPVFPRLHTTTCTPCGMLYFF